MTDKQELAKDRTKYAEDRTDWAEDRTILANERTFAGWMRTGMASLGIAIAMQAVFGKFEPTWMARAAALAFVCLAVLIFAVAVRHSSKLVTRLDSHTAEPISGRSFVWIGGCFIGGALAVGVVLAVV